MSEAEPITKPVDHNNDKYIEDGKNKLIVKCKYCGSKILEKSAGKYMVFEKDLPLMLQDNRIKDQQAEMVTEFYYVDNMYNFENIGFSHTVDNTKYLSCADCDAGPVGYHDMDSKHSYVALVRIVHE